MRLTNEELLMRLREVLSGSDAEAELPSLLEEVQPYDLSEVVARLGDEKTRRVLAAVEPSMSAEILEHLEYIEQYRLLDHLDQAVAQRILDQMSSDAVADLIGAVHPRQARQLLGLLPDEYAATIRQLMSHPENTAGGRMTVDFVSVRQYMTVEQVLTHVRKVGREAETIAYIYVVDSAGRLVGVISVRDLLLEQPRTPIVDFMNTSVVSVEASMDQEEVARLVAQYDLVAVPVVDDHKRLVGIITVDDLVDVIHAEATEDMQKLGGSEPLTETYFQTPVHMLVRKRIGWILILFLAEAYTGTVLRHFESTLSEVVSLAFFIPLLIGTGGNTGSQVVATLVRGLAVGEVSFRDMTKVLSRELVTGLIIGTIMGVTTLLRAYTLGVGSHLGAVVGVTALFIVVWASLISAVLPLILHRLKVDPAVVSGPFITTFVDGTGLFMYFTIARVMLNLA